MPNEKSTKHTPTVLVSACLLGIPCRYDGKSKPNDLVLAHNQDFTYIPFCPECYGGLDTPRPPAEIQADGTVKTKEGVDVTAAYQKGAERAVSLCRDFKIDYAVLKSKSPACGVSSSYDGTFSHTLTARPGMAAAALQEAGIITFSEDTFDPQIILTPPSAHKGEHTMLYVTIETASCVGCGSCEAICPDVFTMNDHGVAQATPEVSAEHLSDVKDAMKMCPVNCIFVDED